MLRVCATSTSEALASVTEIRGALDLTPESTETHWIERAVQRASQAAESYLGYPLGLQTYSETLPAYGDGRLMVSRTPIRTVLRLFNSTSTAEATAYCSTDYRVEDAEAGFITLTNGSAFDWAPVWSRSESGGAFPEPRSESRPWLIDYVAGYTLAGTSSTAAGYGATSTGRSLPYDIEEAVQDTVMAWYRTRGRDPLITQRKVGDLSVSYAQPSEQSGAAGLTPKARALLNPYRRMA